VRSFTSVFRYVTGCYIGNETLVLLGTKNPNDLSVSTLKEKFKQPEIKRLLDWIDFPDWKSLVSTLVFDKAGLMAYAGDGPLNTINEPLVEFAAPRNFSPNENVGQFLRTSLSESLSPAKQGIDIYLTNITSTELESLHKSGEIYSLVMQGISARILEGEVQGKQYLCEALARDPTNPHVLHFLGLSPHAPRNYLKSKLYLDTALICKKQNRTALAYSLLDSAVKIDSTNIIAYNKYYTWLAEAGEIEDAVSVIEQAVQHNPEISALKRDLEYFQSILANTQNNPKEK
ncbi:MAG: hypothetical protein K9M19_00555, partial [Candidatus Marinimicrobia bacterium]|nr:hypothetical protein [Candidatus Neomarinimicrobiota bacterium]